MSSSAGKTLAPVGQAHARLGPSSASRWTECPGSVALSEGRDESSKYADEGNVLHNLASELLQRKRINWAAHVGVTFEGLEITKERHAVVRTYVEYVRELVRKYRGQLAVERRVYMRSVHPTDVWGTADAIIVDESSEVLHVVDLKCGAGVHVKVEGNLQMRLYALGALEELEGLANIRTVRYTIVQPRQDYIGTEEIGVDALLEFGAELSVAADRAMKADGSLETLKAGDHCRFCPAAGLPCPRLKSTAQDMARSEFATQVEAAPEEILAGFMRDVPKVEALIAAVRQEVFKRLSEGERVAGFKLVEGRASRNWADPQVAQQWAVLTLGPDDPFTEPVLKSVAQIETLAKAKGAKMPDDLVERKPGAPSVAPESDKRAEVRPAALEFAGA